jgi:hypothetical protein
VQYRQWQYLIVETFSLVSKYSTQFNIFQNALEIDEQYKLDNTKQLCTNLKHANKSQHLWAKCIEKSVLGLCKQWNVEL